jgi:putative DNA modification/repair radical SAM protein
MPSEQSLKMIAPDKNYQSIYRPMHYIQQGFLQSKEEKQRYRHAPRFAPAGQSTQMIIGATPDNDSKILHLADALYQRPAMKRVYYSGYIPINTYDTRLPALPAPPLVRENRLYQADWLMRFYQFRVDEIVNETHPDLELEIDPKLSWALRNPHAFPVDINTADYEMILRIPGIGVKSAQLIISSRKFGRLTSEHLKKMGVVMKRARYFITCNELSPFTVQEAKPEYIRKILTEPKKKKKDDRQLTIPFQFQ